jgi:hypothetical protein
MKSSDGVAQFLCCTGRVKRTDLSKEGPGVFPFECGSVVSLVSMDSKVASIFLSAVGGYISVISENRALVLELTVGDSQSADRFSVIRNFSLPSGAQRFAAFTQVFAELQTSNLRILLMCERADNDPVLYSFENSEAFPRTFSFPKGSKGIVQACRVTGNSIITSAVSTRDGSVHFWNSTNIHSSVSISVSEPIQALTADSVHVFIALSGEIIVHKLPSGDLVSQVVLRIPVQVDNISRLLRPTSRNSTALVGSILFFSSGVLGSVAIETGKMKSESLTNEYITDLCFGPFDNGPVMTTTSRDRIIAWDSGACLRIASVTDCANIRAIAVSTSRHQPRFVVASWNGISKCLELKSFGLRSRRPDTARERCI